MENQKASSKQIMINYGLTLGVIGIIISVAVYAMGKTYDQHWSIGVINMIVTLAIIITGLKAFRTSNEGLLKLGEAIKIGLGIALISAIIAILYTYIFTSFIEPNYFENMANVQIEKWVDAGMSDEQIKASSEMMKKMSGFGITAVMIAVFSLFFGFVASLIGGLILKKSNEEITSI